MAWVRWILSFALLGALVGCDEDKPIGSTEAELNRALSCEDLLAAIQTDAIAKVDLQVRSLEDDRYYAVGRGLGGPAMAFDDADVLEGQPAPAADAGAEDGNSAPAGYSDTNRQVGDVDEADIVKVGDGGRKLYVIRGNGFYEFDAWPAVEMARVADLEIEGYPIEMFVDADRAVVFSSVYGVPGLDAVDDCGGIGIGPEPAVDIAIDDYYYCGRSHLKVTVVDLSDETPKTAREIYLDGYYSSSRRHGDIVRAVVQTSLLYPAVVPDFWRYVTNDYQTEAQSDLARSWAAEAKAAIGATTLDQWLPRSAEKIDGEIQLQDVQCTNFYSPTPGQTDYGLTQIVGLDAKADEPVQITSVLGQASQVYANAGAMVLTQPDWTWFERGSSSDRTAVHRFAVSDASEETDYEGSGFVEGYVEDQFSIDERDGVIRLATTRSTMEERVEGAIGDTLIWQPPTTDNLVTTLGLRDGRLQELGSTGGLAEGERIMSARFVGDMGYIVTFRQVDPLFAIDLSDPLDPKVLGELKIPGFSEYMHPLGEDHLLTIGRDGDDTGINNGVALQIFDVSDPVRPELKHKELVGEGYSEASYNHKAFNYYAAYGVLAFPFVSYSSRVSSTLELWDVTVEGGIHRLGAVDHSSLVENACVGWVDPVGGVPIEADYFESTCGYTPQVNRGVFISAEDETVYVYSISYGGLLVHQLGALETPLATATYE
jgi:hypothetical protein